MNAEMNADKKVQMAPLVAQSAGAGLFFGVWQVQRLAMLAAVDFRFRAELRLHFVAEEIPALQMAGAELAFSSFSLHARMRGVRRLTLVPSLSVATSSATGTGLSEAAYFGFAISRMTSISGCPRLFDGEHDLIGGAAGRDRSQAMSCRRSECVIG